MTDIIVGKHDINLLQPELIPDKPLWSLKRVLMLWLLALLIMVGWIFFSQQQSSKLKSEHQELRVEKTRLNDQMILLEAELEAHKPSNKLKEKIDLLKLVLNNKTQLHEELTDSTNTQVAGFAQSMTELSENHNRGISLQRVKINKDDMAFKGITKSAELVPAWLTGFEKSTFLSGKTFVNFTLQENEDSALEFIVSSSKTLEDFNNE